MTFEIEAEDMHEAEFLARDAYYGLIYQRLWKSVKMTV